MSDSSIPFDKNKKSASMKPFFILWTGQSFSFLGSNIVQFALVWYLTKTTGSATVLAIASIVGLLPQVLLGPLVGTLVDRWNRRMVMFVADSVIALATIGLAILFGLDLIQTWHIYTIMFIRALGEAFHWPAMIASTTLMVPKKHFTRIQGMNQALFGAINIISPMLGALFMELLPMQGILAIDVATALLAIIPLLFISIPQPLQSFDSTEGYGHNNKPSVFDDFKAGFKFLCGFPGLLILILNSTLGNFLLTPAAVMLPILVKTHFAGGAAQLAWIETSLWVGMVSGGILLSAWGGFKRQINTIQLSAFLMGLSIIFLGCIPASGLWIAVATVLFIGLALTMYNASVQAIAQAVVVPQFQGRVFSLMASLGRAASPLGLLMAGPISDSIGVQFLYIAGGSLTVSTAIALLLIPAVQNIENKPRTC